MTASETAAYWDARAASFDEEPDHGLRDPLVREAWLACLLRWLPAVEAVSPPSILDIGCGTGTLAALLAPLGYGITGADLSLAMLERARQKTSEIGVRSPLVQMDASLPAFRAGAFDVVLSRHLVWALPSVDGALAQWAELLRPGGRLVFIEGHWAAESGTRTGTPAAVLEDAARRYFGSVQVEPLRDAVLWGKAIADERYALIAAERRQPRV